MRRYCVWLGFIFVFGVPGLYAQVNPLKVCVLQYDEGNDALRLARELSSRKLGSGTPLAVVAITGKVLSAPEEQKLADSGSPFVRVLITEKNARVRSAEIERIGCDYDIRVSYHESADNFDANSPAGIPSSTPGSPRIEPSGDRETVGYELRKSGSKKVLARAIAPPLTVYIRQGRRVFNPYILFADQIVKKLNSAN